MLSLRMQLKIVTWGNEDMAADALSIRGFERYRADDYALAACYPAHRRPDRAVKQTGGDEMASRDFMMWWEAGEEPLYYIVSPKVSQSINFYNC